MIIRRSLGALGAIGAVLSFGSLAAQSVSFDENEAGQVTRGFYSGEAEWLLAQEDPRAAWHLFPALDEVSLNNHPVSAAELDYVSRLPHLKWLDVGFGPEGVLLEDGALVHLRHAVNLVDLNLCKGTLRDRDLEVLPTLEKLEHLSLEAGPPHGGSAKANLTDAAGETIAQIKSLQSLRIGAVSPGKLGDRFIAHLVTLPNLRTLQIAPMPFTDRSLSLIARHLRLGELDISSPHFTPEGRARSHQAREGRAAASAAVYLKQRIASAPRHADLC